MRVAVTVWDGRVSPVFDVCREALVFEISDGHVVSRSRHVLESDNPWRKVQNLVDCQVQTLICGAISQYLYHELTSRGLRVIGFVAGDLQSVLAAFIDNSLPCSKLAMPGCGGRRIQARWRRRNSSGQGGSNGGG